MHGLVVRLQIDTARAEDAVKLLHEFVVPTVKQGAGFVSGTWMRSEDGTGTCSVLLYEDEEVAKAAAGRAAEAPPSGAPTTFVSAEVFEVMAQA